MKNILFAIDFKRNEQLLVNKAFEFTEEFNTKIWLLHFAAPNPDVVGYESGLPFIRDNRATEL